MAERFFSTLKRELVHRFRFATRSQARSAIFEYVEVFYNVSAGTPGSGWSRRPSSRGTTPLPSRHSAHVSGERGKLRRVNATKSDPKRFDSCLRATEKATRNRKDWT